MGSYDVAQRAAQAGVSATVTRADGRVEEYGLVSYHARNPIRRWAVRRMLRRGDRLDKEATMRASTTRLVWRALRRGRT